MLMEFSYYLFKFKKMQNGGKIANSSEDKSFKAPLFHKCIENLWWVRTRVVLKAPLASNKRCPKAKYLLSHPWWRNFNSACMLK